MQPFWLVSLYRLSLIFPDLLHNHVVSVDMNKKIKDSSFNWSTLCILLEILEKQSLCPVSGTFVVGPEVWTVTNRVGAHLNAVLVPCLGASPLLILVGLFLPSLPRRFVQASSADLSSSFLANSDDSVQVLFFIIYFNCKLKHKDLYPREHILSPEITDLVTRFQYPN